MNEEMIALAQRLIDCPRFRWLPGMAGTDALGVPFRCALTHHSGGMMVVAGMAFMPAYPDALARMFPDLSDPATLGCLLQLVREAWGDESAYLCDYGGYDSVNWGVVSHVWDEKRNKDGPKAWFSCLLGDASTEAAALVVALEAAP